MPTAVAQVGLGFEGLSFVPWFTALSVVALVFLGIAFSFTVIRHNDKRD